MLHARFGLDRMVLQQVMAKAGLVGRAKGKSRAGVGMVSSCCTSWGKRRPSASNTTLDGTPESPAYKRGHWQRKPNRSNAPSAEVIIRLFGIATAWVLGCWAYRMYRIGGAKTHIGTAHRERS